MPVVYVPSLGEELEVTEEGFFSLPPRDDYTVALLRRIAKELSKATKAYEYQSQRVLGGDDGDGEWNVIMSD